MRSPKSVEELGISDALVTDLVLRRCLLEGKTNVQGLSNALALRPSIIDRVVQELREKNEVEVLGMDGRDFRIALTSLGQTHATARLEQSRYAGAAPVSLESYRSVVAAQRLAVYVNRDTLKQAFADLVISDDLLDELGPALNANGAMFLYGPPGTGKTSIAERIVRISPDHVLVPHAVEVDSQIVSVFDRTVHLEVDQQPDDLDPRWVLCQRPRVVVGGELTGSMLDLTYDQTSGVYLAPLQMKANNGVMIIDDFGRQVLTPDQLLNRWIVPLDRRIDFLSLNYGVSFEVPFDVKVVLSTNLDPSDLGDEAFFRRIQSKIFIGPITAEAFDWILARVAHAMGIGCDTDAAEYLRAVCQYHGGDLRPYLPADVCKLLKALAQYEGIAPQLNRATIDRVLALYYTKGTGGPGGYGKTASATPASRPAPIAAPAPAPAPTAVSHPAPNAVETF
ncbi:MAG: AAA family ATPase [Actinomycetota bacterium]